MRYLPISLLALCVGTFVSLADQRPLHANTIDWNPAFELVSVADLDLSGTNIRGVNGGNDTGISVGGVAFDSYQSPEFGVISGEPAWITSETSDGDLNSFSTAGLDVYTTTTGEPGLDTLLATHTYNIGPLSQVTYTLNGLTIGQTYQVQIVGQADDRGVCCDDYVTLVDGGDDAGGVTIHRFVDLDGDQEKHVSTAIGSFMATAATQQFTTVGQTVDGSPTAPASLWLGHGGFSAVLLSEVAAVPIPELSSGTLLCLGGLSLLRRRRSR